MVKFTLDFDVIKTKIVSLSKNLCLVVLITSRMTSCALKQMWKITSGICSSLFKSNAKKAI